MIGYCTKAACGRLATKLFNQFKKNAKKWVGNYETFEG